MLSNERLAEIRAQVERWCTDPTLPDNAIPASPADVFDLLAEVDRLRAQADAAREALGQIASLTARRHLLAETIARQALSAIAAQEPKP